MIRSLVYYALRVWSEPTPLDFHEVGALLLGLHFQRHEPSSPFSK